MAGLNVGHEVYLPVDEVASLLGITMRTVRKKITSGQMPAKEESGVRGRGGVRYMVPLSELDDRMQIKYWKKREKEQLGKESIVVPEDVRQARGLDEYSEDDRRVIQAWINAVQDWQRYRSGGYPGDLQAADDDFVRCNQNKYPDIALSVDSLYRKWKAIREQDYDGLIDKRGRHRRGQNSIPELAWELFKYYYLDESQHPIKQCFDYVTWWYEKEMPELIPELPSYHAFRRAIKNIPFAVVKYWREGDKAYEDDAAPYITRLYEDLEINEVWVADNHTLDVISKDDQTGKQHRLYITAFQDVRSRKMVGWYITDRPNSDGVLYALRKGILKHGIPRYIYTDNGREFLCFDIGGRGRRKTAKNEDHTPPPIFTRLGIGFWNAKVRNGRSKIVERVFREFKDKCSRLFPGFVGGNVTEKPEKLKQEVKSTKIVLDKKLQENFDLFIDGIFNKTPHSGAGMYGRTPEEVFAEEMVTVRRASEDDLNLMLLRSTRMQTVREKGVYLDLYGAKTFYWNSEFLMTYQGHRVYLRYDPEHLETVRVYNEKDEFLCVIPADNDTTLTYHASKEELKKANAKIKRHKKIIKEYNDNSGLEAYPMHDAVDLMVWKARQNLAAGGPTPNPKVVELNRANEPTAAQLATDADLSAEVKVDIEKMVKISKFNII